MQINLHPLKTEAEGRMVESVFQEIEGQVRVCGPSLPNMLTHSWAMTQRTREGPQPPVT